MRHVMLFEEHRDTPAIALNIGVAVLKKLTEEYLPAGGNISKQMEWSSVMKNLHVGVTSQIARKTPELLEEEKEFAKCLGQAILQTISEKRGLISGSQFNF